MAMSQTMDRMDNKLVTPSEIEWEPAPAVLPPGAQGAVLYGDPTKDGLFAMQKGYRVAPHTLSKAGTFTMISGTFRIGMGEKADPSRMATLLFSVSLPPQGPLPKLMTCSIALIRPPL